MAHKQLMLMNLLPSICCIFGGLVVCSAMILPYCLAVTPCSLLRPPPLFSGEITVKGYFTSITRPPPRGPLEPVCRTAVLHVYTCCKSRRVVFVYQACRK